MKMQLGLILGGFVLLAATLWAEPAEEMDDLLKLGTDEEVPADQVEALTVALKEASPWQVRVEATFLRIAKGAAADVLGEHHPDRDGSAKEIPASLAKKLVELAGGRGPVQREPLPPLVLYAGVTGRLAATGRHRYVQDYDLEKGASPADATPVVGWIDDGAAVVVTVRREGARLALDLSPQWAEVTRPIVLFEAALKVGAEGRPVRIELPEMRMMQLRERVTLPAVGGFVLAGSGNAWDQKTLRLVLLEVRAE